ncbi:phosphatase PAP2 family protein [Occultella gossypii]|uniref:Phosphatase PAP2 family protein n=1 Tax=Occultella gossypii TaxID=2800820 RepID=A0ABS7SAC6_9MICO|nr:phosphatase PAP2 family protein [Occultella gossypii]MBZ2197301.1 phosphatase PAP2 family protein [Occultella gossypii]
MTAVTMAPTPAPLDARGRRGLTAPLLAALASAAVLVVTWWFFVTTRLGQLIDDAALSGADAGPLTLTQAMLPILDVVSVPFVAGAVVAAVVIAVAQRRWSIAGAAVLLLVGANVTTQILKAVLPRPDLGATLALSNSLPSGHTTVAASVAATALLIAPHRWRGPVAVGGAVYAALTGLATMAGEWHRASDVVAAFAVAAFWYFIIEAARSVRRRSLPRGYRGAPTANAVTLLSVVAIATGLLGAVIGAITALNVPVYERPGEVIAYVGSCSSVIAASAVATLAMLAMRPHHRASSYSAGS